MRRIGIGAPPSGFQSDPLLSWIVNSLLDIQNASHEDTAEKAADDNAALYQPTDPTLTAIAAFNTNGFLVQTAADTFAGRTLQAPAAGFTITNPAGTAGDPTFVLANDLGALEALGSTGIAVRTAADTWAQRTITGTSPVVVSGGDGVAGNPSISVNIATQSDQETSTSLTTLVTPARQQYHPSAAKVWGLANGAGTSLTVNYGVSSITDNGTGTITFNFAAAMNFSSANFVALGTIGDGNSRTAVKSTAGSASITFLCMTDTNTIADPATSYNVACFGDL